MKNIIIGILVAFLTVHMVQGQTKIMKPPHRPVPVKRPYPQVPELLNRGDVEGIVKLSLLVDENGNVEKVKIIRSTAYLFDTLCINAAKQWKFKPGEIADSLGGYVKSKFWYPLTFDWSSFRRELIKIY